MLDVAIVEVERFFGRNVSVGVANWARRPAVVSVSITWVEFNVSGS